MPDDNSLILKPTGPFIEIESLVGKKPQPIKWLWPQMIPVGELTILFGRGGVGKSTIARSIAAILSNGTEWPTSQVQAPKCTTLLLEDEDSSDRTLASLNAHNANLDKIPLMGMVNLGKQRRPFSIATDLPYLENTIQQNPDIRLIILSPINSFIGLDDDKNMFKLRRTLSSLSDFSHRTGTSVLGIAHPRKGSEGHVHDSLAGSHLWVTAARSVLLAIEDSDDPNGTRYFGTIKGNYCKSQSTLSYTIEEKLVDGHEGASVEAPYIAWGKKTTPERMETLFARVGNEIGQEHKEASIWLEELLSDGPLPAQDIYKTAKEVGFKDPSTIRKAGTKIGVIIQRQGTGSGSQSIWTLPTHLNDQKASVNADSVHIHTSFSHPTDLVEV